MQEVRKGKEMTDLTEKWKKKQLERGSYYYVKTKMGNILIDCINYDRPNHDGFLYDVEEVLAPVPSYNEFEALKMNCEFTHTCLNGSRKKNTELIGLLKECSEYMTFRYSSKKTIELLTKINEVLK